MDFLSRCIEDSRAFVVAGQESRTDENRSFEFAQFKDRPVSSNQAAAFFSHTGRLAPVACLLVFALVGLGVGSAWAEPSAGADRAAYLIQPGDVLGVSVWREDGLQQEVLVRPDGGISFPLVGEVRAAGQSVPQVAEEISEKLAKFIPDPVVNVTLLQLQGNQVYVIGKVNRPGNFTVTRQLDVLQALSMAGGMSAFADDKNILVLRRGANGQQSAHRFNYRQVEQGEALEQNIHLEPGDVVVVP